MIEKNHFIGATTGYHCADGVWRRRVYLDAAASTPMLQAAKELADVYLEHHANTHSAVHFSARGATQALAWARQRVLQFVNADANRYLCLFVGTGATAALNRLAHYMAQYRASAPTVLVSLMEHHANDLAHRRLASVEHLPLVGQPPAMGVLDTHFLASRLCREASSVRYLAVSAASNVTGIINPLREVAALSSMYGVPWIVDAAQAVAHLPMDVCAWGEPDAVVFSGHKMYAPGAPGVLIVRRDIVAAAQPVELGGGMVTRVSREGYSVSEDLVEREEAGTPNLYGVMALVGALDVLQSLSMARVQAHEQHLLGVLLAELKTLPEVVVYGDLDRTHSPRVGVVSFNVKNLDHGYVAAALNDYHAVAVRNECFCAHPYVRELILPELWAVTLPDGLGDEEAETWINRKRGMVRVSLGLHSTMDDVYAFMGALRDVVAKADTYLPHYRVAADGNYYHREFVATDIFDPQQWLDARDLRMGGK